MKILNFKCKLQSDVILNQKSATEGSRATLDFIPGSNFLGIVASQLYPQNLQETWAQKKAMLLFHTGDVKYGDAHPSVDGIRSLKIPASMYYPKLSKVTEQCYIHYLIPNLVSIQKKTMQLKQCRSGFYCFKSNIHVAEEVNVYKNFSIKSAYDKKERRSRDKMMYGYEALRKGAEFLFEVVISQEAEVYADEIKAALTGFKRIGRSRTAQYGLVDIQEYSYSEAISSATPFEIEGKLYVSVYADSRLIFLDEYGIPTFQPSAADLGIMNGEIDWSKSQIRTFRYAPWNYKRQVYDTDRCGIEKGSVFIVKLNNGYRLSEIQYVGFYQNEGFGKVIYNPDFLKAKSVPQNEGKAEYQIKESVLLDQQFDNDIKISSNLLCYLRRQQTKDDNLYMIYTKVNDFVESHKKLFKDGTFASQWRKIRSIAMKGENIKEAILKYLTHGIAAAEWEKLGRLKKITNFMDSIDEKCLQEAIINLSSEMAKACKKD